MIFIAAACVVAGTTVVVGVAVASRVQELIAPAPPPSAETETRAAPEDPGCTAHLLHLYQQA